MAKYASTGVTSGEVDLLDDFSNTIAASLPVATANELGFFKSGSNLSIDGNNALNKTDTTYSTATTSASGLMSTADKSKLDGIADNANNYVLPVASSSTIGGAKRGSGLTEVDGEFSVVSSFKQVYTDSVNATQYTNHGVHHHGKFMGFGCWSRTNTSQVVPTLQYPTIGSNGAYSNWQNHIYNQTGSWRVNTWGGSWGISNNYGNTGYTHYYDPDSNNGKAGGVEITVDAGFSTSDKIFLIFSCPDVLYNTYATYLTMKKYLGGFRWQSGTGRWYEPYHAWGATGNWGDHSASTSYVGGTLGEEVNLLDELSGGNFGRPGPSFSVLANVPTTSAFKVRPWFRMLPVNNSFTSDRAGAQVKFQNSQIRMTAIITS